MPQSVPFSSEPSERAIRSIAAKLGFHPATLRNWVRERENRKFARSDELRSPSLWGSRADSLCGRDAIGHVQRRLDGGVPHEVDGGRHYAEELHEADALTGSLSDAPRASEVEDQGNEGHDLSGAGNIIRVGGDPARLPQLAVEAQALGGTL